ncbi:MAG: MCP four helix bundle domain-containing protein [Candidatus Omnitrophica bacterium]|nr:MCP four helix bundle domain-containing protein [Candidatus Omnitrophota bacterium]MBU4477646.1 MCP four helix bundle domain-containing protein [Candidatus Omnitrophota bacterium]MCG2703136.1 MCP four helix bundle domain-containing protein [Candidatus Omnitrophota bacterium]
MLKKLKFRDWSIGSKLLCGFFVIIFFLVTMSGYTLFSISEILEQTEEMEINDINAISMSMKMNEIILQLSPLFEHALITKDKALLEDAEKSKKSFDIFFSEHKNFSRNFPPAVEALDSLRRHFDSFYAIGREMVQRRL